MGYIYTLLIFEEVHKEVGELAAILAFIADFWWNPVFRASLSFLFLDTMSISHILLVYATICWPINKWSSDPTDWASPPPVKICFKNKKNSPNWRKKSPKIIEWYQKEEKLCDSSSSSWKLSVLRENKSAFIQNTILEEVFFKKRQRELLLGFDCQWHVRKITDYWDFLFKKSFATWDIIIFWLV